MLKRLANTGINMFVLIASIAVFFVAFIALQGLAAAQKPPTIQVLSATRNLNMGDVINPEDLDVKTVYQDDNASLYIPADEVSGVLGGLVAIPMIQSQPIMRNAIVARSAEGTGLAAVLTDFPEGFSLFPLPLDGSNMVAPAIESFLPGDLVGITVVISGRPQPPETQTPETSLFEVGNTANVTPTPIPEESARKDALAQAYPPLAKDLFSQGVRVIVVQGLPTVTSSTNPSGNDAANVSASTYADYTKPHILILLVPTTSIETLSLALQEGDRLVVTLMERGSDQPSSGFTYWDFEQLFKMDREKVLNSGGR